MNQGPKKSPPDNDQHDDSRLALMKVKIVSGIVLGVLGTPVLAAIAGGIFQHPAAVIIVAIAGWLWAGYLTAAHAKSPGMRVLTAFLFALGYGLLPFVLLSIVCGGMR